MSAFPSPVPSSPPRGGRWAIQTGCHRASPAALHSSLVRRVVHTVCVSRVRSTPQLDNRRGSRPVQPSRAQPSPVDCRHGVPRTPSYVGTEYGTAYGRCAQERRTPSAMDWAIAPSTTGASVGRTPPVYKYHPMRTLRMWWLFLGPRAGWLGKATRMCVVADILLLSDTRA